jgi:hypothetical protein
MKPALLLALIVFHSVSAQQGDYSMGARSSGMGSANVALADPSSAFNNMAGVARQEKSSILFSIKNLYSLEGLFALGAAYNQKYKQGAFLFNLYRFGDRLFSEHKFGMGYSHQIRFVSLGVQLNYLQQSIESFGTSGSIILELGGMAEIFPGLILGAYISNPNRATIGRYVREPLPVVMKTGLAYKPDEKITLCWELQRGPDDHTFLKIGLEYILSEIFPLRAGTVLNPARFTYGFGIHLKKIQLEYGTELNALLGITHQLSINYQFSRK